MRIFSAEKEARLTAAKAEFRNTILANDLFARIVVTCIENWAVDTSPEIETLMQPSIMPGNEAGMPDALVGGVQVGFRNAVPGTTKSTGTTWRFIDLFAYKPHVPGYEVVPTTPVISTATPAEVTPLFDTWKSAVGGILGEFGQHELLVNPHTGEIDLRENMYEGKMPVFLPTE